MLFLFRGHNNIYSLCKNNRQPSGPSKRKGGVHCPFHTMLLRHVKQNSNTAFRALAKVGHPPQGSYLFSFKPPLSLCHSDRADRQGVRECHWVSPLTMSSVEVSSIHSPLYSVWAGRTAPYESPDSLPKSLQG